MSIAKRCEHRGPRLTVACCGSEGERISQCSSSVVLSTLSHCLMCAFKQSAKPQRRTTIRRFRNSSIVIGWRPRVWCCSHSHHIPEFAGLTAAGVTTHQVRRHK